ncbi:MAG: hypothetical protein RR623_01330 [Bacilli bacterium]
MIYTLIKYDKEDKLEALFSFESITSYSESWTGTVSKSTTEQGFPIADHINIENPVFEINATFSDYSLFNTDNEIYWDGEDFVSNRTDKSLHDSNKLKQEIVGWFIGRGVFELWQTSENSFSRVASEKLSELKSSSVQTYKNCVITDINVSESESISSAYSIKMKIEQLTIASVQTRKLSKDELQPALQRKLAKTPDNIGNSTSSTNTNAGSDPSKTVAQKSGDEANVVTKAKEGVPLELQKELGGSQALLNAVNSANAYSDNNQYGLAVVKQVTPTHYEVIKK